MYENMTFDKLEKRMLARVRSTFDKREGSIIYDATAPAALELAEAYIMARVILRQTFATTADREFLTLRAAEFNIYPEAATPAEVLGQFDIPVPLLQLHCNGACRRQRTYVQDEMRTARPRR